MSNIRDAGRFIFNQETPLFVKREGQLVPGNPDNMKNDTTETERHAAESLYTYSMGISEIEARNNTYEMTNAFVTKPINLKENILEVSLSALEEHPVFDEVSGRANKRQTSIEYYISLTDNPTQDDWIPVLPREKKEVLSERLFFEGLTAKTLFPFNLDSVVLYENGVRVNPGEYYVLNNQEVQIESVNTDHIYTVDYTPNIFINNPYTIEVNDYKHKTTRIVEEFTEGTDINKTLTLKHVPYVDREQLLLDENYNPSTSVYRPIEVSIVNAAIRGPNATQFNYVPPVKMNEGEPYMNNKTLYLDNSWSNMTPFNLSEGYLGIDYFQHKNKVTLSEHINIPMIEENEKETPGTGTIRVAYDALVTSFRLKVILRRNTEKEITATPRLKEYHLNFKSIR